jgi:hypothetical protein
VYVGAAADCEAIAAGFLGQPVNALTTFGFVVAGALIMARRPQRRWVGIALVSTGIGSFLFHGPMPPWNEWAHDVTLTWLLVVVAGSGTRVERYTRIPALLAIGALFAIAPTVADPIGVGVTIVAVASVLRGRNYTALPPLLLLAAVAVFGRLGATGGPLCDPSSLFQPHGVWHLGAALAVAWWALGAPTSRSVRVAQEPRRS